MLPFHQQPWYWPWASCQIRKIAGCACAGNAGNLFPRGRLQRKPPVSDPGMPWYMSGSLTRGGEEKVHGIPGACAPAILRIWQEAHVGLTGLCLQLRTWVGFWEWGCIRGFKKCLARVHLMQYIYEEWQGAHLRVGGELIRYIPKVCVK